jgi:uncharacterized protein (TIGR00730 family)
MARRKPTRKTSGKTTRTSRRRPSGARTPSGKPAGPEVLASATKKAIEGVRERTEEGHRKAGRVPPSQRVESHTAGATRMIVDEALRDAYLVTEDTKLLQEPRGPEFTRSDPWRVLRIMGEFIEGFDTLAHIDKGVTIFGSARIGPDDPHYDRACETARLLSKEGFAILTGAGPGIMEAANRGAQLGGSPSIGCNIELPFEQGANPYVDTLINFRYFFVRKTMFIKYSSAFIIFPGGFGTLDELFESLTLIQTGKIHQFPVVLFGSAYWAGLLRWVHTKVARERKIAAEDLDLLTLTDDPGEAAEVVMQAYEAQRKIALRDGRK